MKESMQIFDWELCDDELEKNNNNNQCRAFKAENFVTEKGPYKSLEELWDDDAWNFIFINKRFVQLKK